MSEAPVGVWAWAGLVVLVAVYVVAWEIYLWRSGHELLTTEFKEALRHPVWGAVTVFIVAGGIGAFLWHMFNARGGPQ